MKFSYTRKAVSWSKRQTFGFMQNVRELGRRTKWYDFLPASIADLIKWVWRSVLYSFGSSTRDRQIASSIALLIASILSSALTLGLTVGAVFVFAVTLLVGLLRLWPWFDAKFVQVRSSLAGVGGF